MKLQPDTQPHLNTVTSYGGNHIEINAIRHDESMLLMPQGPVIPWPVAQFTDLNIDHFTQIAQLKPALVIFGSGAKIRFPRPELLQPLIAAKIGLETMDLQAACRTYNILMAEGRNVLAALIFEK